ncbi:MarR family winged helix-turn-helix transcriptional regulator [Methylorubrum suomiense]|uniref:HTH marR-type domain-containing protein n=1 Tax=Methylorubrum suomiense TaxID=144191 RepID=A0ABQ4V4J2_9HYPH|nr:MarR family winged helix-turn-helix transcriptional regulator [Methylorubrum suomiense]GJE78062.1 hypothetical protein BGCPKDLD_4673 [Methylorubrum suomiense]
MTQPNPTDTLIELGDAFERIAPNLTLRDCRAFVFVARNEPASLQQVQEHLAVPQSTASRTVARLNGTGAGLIDHVADPDSRRRARLTLSPKGRELIARLAVILTVLTLTVADQGLWHDPFPDDPPGYDACADTTTFRCERTG